MYFLSDDIAYLVFAKSKFPNILYCFPPTKSCRSRAVWYLCVCQEKGLYVYDRERKNRAGQKKKHRKPRREWNWIWGEIQFSSDIRMIFNQFKTKLYPRSGSRTWPQRTKGKTKGNEDLWSRELKKRKPHFSFLEGWRLNYPSRDLGKPCAERGTLAAGGGLGLKGSAGEGPVCHHLCVQHNTSHFHWQTHTGSPNMFLVTCCSQHCHLLLFLIFSSYAWSCEAKKETEKQFSLLSYQTALCWARHPGYFAAVILFISETNGHQHC